MARICPDDRTALEQKTIHGIQVDVCPQCGGIWLDKGEMYRVRELQKNELKDFDTTAFNHLPARKSEPSCPVCSQLLHPFRYMNSNIELETCPNLCGLWVPEAELDKVIALDVPAAARAAVAEMENETEANIAHHNHAAFVWRLLDQRRGWPFFWPVPQQPY